ncbi:MAG: 1-deoxy-D-xylulose-5-phosphate reductoisomerase [Candidatus Mariimomonas ferrooxydans]
MKRISILGSTGSIGRSTLEVVGRFPGKFKVLGLAAKKNIQLLESQIHTCRPELVAVADESAGEKLKKRNLPVKVLTGNKGLAEVATLENVEMVVSAIVGSEGFLPTLAAIKAGKNIALASKEALVMAGSIIMAEASKKGVKIIPVDSEHSAIFQCINGRSRNEIRRIILTASGGPFFKKNLAELKAVTPEEALKHPNWLMGEKITIDSATLMNKGLEVIEAYWLFGLPAERIKVLLHPQSIVHSMVEFIDGSVIAQMSVPDMKGPITYALSYPQRFEHVLPSLDLSRTGELTFEEPDRNKYPSLSLAYDALRTGGTMPAVLNAANEVAVEAFLNKKIPFTGIHAVVADIMAQHRVLDGSSLEDILKASKWSREKAEEAINERCEIKTKK